MTKFRLHTGVLMRLRLRREHEARLAVARTQSEGQAVRTRIERLQAALAIHDQAVRQMIDRGGDATNLAIYRHSIEEIGDELAASKARLGLLEEQAADQRQQLGDAMRHRKALSNLRDRVTARQHRRDERIAAGQQDDVQAAYRHEDQL
jgi:flagellar export protein FliJ